MAESDKPWEVQVYFRCRRGRVLGLRALDIEQEIAKGRAVCPFKGKTKLLRVSHPADNRAGPEAATAFPEKCPICGLSPDRYDFDIR
ncbi:hypothetical protein COX03_02610 [Candidatus Woesebacteria bacterium CG22_combo_CG10-13_8_21_14_all_39_10]|uniref:Uncharacterized protein n=3 Tax=Candidatus Woeseibacteriota TaxID=1752722 RepID=A0A2M7XA21_9BACT|nr:hypothetical protein [Candidatus Microgenomates bacterium]PIP57527.1 MAG: hypothetical protein COX03_02610 [Candidatus Woesebacteria bacterium CG22_combo_CG10-13_8_21_14_all_39_10]PIZ49901.1 MAG: hypothetical protein COY29_00840 [Candidatus Woesebacteria bacterium CG_4_10_14_0_2_um_filter_39_14]PJA43017.1 MAG: hypothetical protein CO176_00585 [Candidatus Woesebacteria bacterium CG_4_9_14_3_um_filter_39_10]